MGSNAKKKTTMAKLNREHRQRERRMEKDARKVARKLSPAEEAPPMDAEVEDDGRGLKLPERALQE